MGIFDLIHTENTNFNKVCITFSFLDEEVNKITDLLETKYFDIVLLYGEAPAEQTIKSQAVNTGEEEIMMGRSLGIFKQIFNIVKYSSSLIFSIVS